MNLLSKVTSKPSPLGGRWWGAFRHALALIREDKLFSAIYIAGTAVAIASAMVVAILLNVKMANIIPETHRDRTLYVNALQYKDSEMGGSLYSGCSTLAVDELFSKLECVEVATGMRVDPYREITVDSISAVSNNPQNYVKAIFCDPCFFQLYDFQFLEGRHFNEQEFRDGEQVCVVTDKLLERLRIGRELQADLLLYSGSVPYRIIGVIKRTSPLMDASYAEIYAPSLGKKVSFTDSNPTNYQGNLSVRVLLKKGYSREDFLKEVEPLCRRYEAAQSSAEGEPVHFTLDAKSHFFVCFGYFHSDDESTTDKAKNLMPPAILMLIFLLLPALNLSGLISNRMEARRAEMGIRKAFGAKRRWLLREVIGENLVLTCCCGLVGWVLSWLFYLAVRHTAVFQALILREGNLTADITLDFNMFVTPALFLIVFLCCVVLNLMVALIPSWTSLRKPIVESLNQKK